MAISGTSQNRDCFGISGAGTVTGMLGAGAYFLPVTKDRFIRNSFDLVRKQTEEQIEDLGEIAETMYKKKKPDAEQKLLLNQLGLNEDIVQINSKIKSLQKSITDQSEVKSLKQKFANVFKACKKSETERDFVTSKAFRQIKLKNLALGVIIGYVIGSLLGKAVSAPRYIQQNQ